MSKKESSLVTQKFCSALVTYYLRPNAPWIFCIRTVTCSFGNGSALNEELLEKCPSNLHILSILDSDSLLAVLWFTANLAEEGAKTDSNNQEQ